MSTLVVCESMWGNTRSVAEAIAEGLGPGVLVLDVGSAPAALPAGVSLLVVGGPTHAFSMSRASTREDATGKGAPAGHERLGIREWLAALALPSGENPSGELDVATFDTRVAKVRKLPGSAARAAGKSVRKHHLGRLVATETFLVDDLAGPLLDGELDRAREWGRSLLAASEVSGRTSG